MCLKDWFLKGKDWSLAQKLRFSDLKNLKKTIMEMKRLILEKDPSLWRIDLWERHSKIKFLYSGINPLDLGDWSLELVDQSIQQNFYESIFLGFLALRELGSLELGSNLTKFWPNAWSFRIMVKTCFSWNELGNLCAEQNPFHRDKTFFLLKSKPEQN